MKHYKSMPKLVKVMPKILTVSIDSKILISGFGVAYIQEAHVNF